MTRGSGAGAAGGAGKTPRPEAGGAGGTRPPHRPGIARARSELAAAELLTEHGYPEPAVSRSFHAAFLAAETALLVLGETRAEYSDVVSAFVRRVVRERSLDPTAGQLLRSLFNRSYLADHLHARTPQEEAEAALADAGYVVDAVVTWLADPALSRPAPAGNGATRVSTRPARRRTGS